MCRSFFCVPFIDNIEIPGLRVIREFLYFYTLLTVWSASIAPPSAPDGRVFPAHCRITPVYLTYVLFHNHSPDEPQRIYMYRVEYVVKILPELR